MDKNSKIDSFLGKVVDFVFSRDERKWLLLILILGVVLRVIVASNIPPVADEMVHGTHAIGVSKLAPLSTMTQGPVWFYLTDYAYRIFNVHLLTARFLSVVFGSLSIVLVYLIAGMLFNKRAGLVAAFLLAVSIFHITWAASYQDQTMMFFVLLASYFFIKKYQKTKQISILSSVLLGIALLVKIITGVFIVVFGAFMLGILYKDYKKDSKRFKNNLKRTLIFGLILVVSMLPLFSYNYFLYKEKGIVDLPFAQFLKINVEFYSGPGLAHGEGFVINKLPRNLYTVITHYFIKEDVISFVLGLFGIGYLASRFREKRFGELFLLAMFFFSMLFIASAIVLQTHYTSFFPLFSIFAAGFLTDSAERLKKFKYCRHMAYGGAIILLIFMLYSLRGPLTSQSAVEKARSFAINSIDGNTLVVLDSRIYRGTNAWTFNDKHYVESNYLAQIMDISDVTSERVPVKMMFIECVTDDCGWGTVKDQPEFNRSVEQIVEAFKSASQKTTVISGGGSISGVRGAEITGEPFFRTYEVIVRLKPAMLNAVDSTHSHFFYHIPRNENPEQAFDYYSVNGGPDTLLNVISYAALYVILGLATLSIGLPFYLLFRRNTK